MATGVPMDTTGNESIQTLFKQVITRDGKFPEPPKPNYLKDKNKDLEFEHCYEATSGDAYKYDHTEVDGWPLLREMTLGDKVFIDFADVDLAIYKNLRGRIDVTQLNQSGRKTLDNLEDAFTKVKSWRRHYINTNNGKGLLMTPHQKATQRGSVNTKTRAPLREFNKYRKVIEKDSSLGEFLAEHVYSNEPAGVHRHGTTCLTLCDLDTLVREKAYVEESKTLHTSLLKYARENLDYVGPDPCRVAYHGHCASCTTFLKFWGYYLNVLWVRHLRFATKLQAAGIYSPLTPDDLDLGGKYMDMEEYKTDSPPVPLEHYISNVRQMLTLVWGQLGVNIPCVDGWSPQELQMFDDVPSNLDRLETIFRNRMTLGFDEKTRIELPRDVQETITKRVEEKRGSNTGPSHTKYALVYVLWDDPTILEAHPGPWKHDMPFAPDLVDRAVEMLACDRTTLSRRQFSNLYHLDDYLKRPLTNVWDFKITDSFQDLIQHALNFLWNMRRDMNKPMYRFQPEYDNGKAVTLDNAHLLFPSAINFPGFGRVPYESVLVCECAHCAKLTTEQRVIAAYGDRMTALNYTFPANQQREADDKCLMSFEGRISQAYHPSASPKNPRSAVASDFIEFLARKGTNVVFTEYDTKTDDDYVNGYNFFSATPEGLYQEHGRYDMNREGSISDWLFITTLVASLEISRQSERTAQTSLPGVKHEWRLPSQQRIKNPRKAAGYPYDRLGKADVFRKLMGKTKPYVNSRGETVADSALDALYMHHTSYGVAGMSHVSTKVALSAKTKTRSITGVGVMSAYFQRAGTQAAKELESLKNGGTIENSMFFNGSWNHHMLASSGFAKPEQMVNMSDDAEKFDKTISLWEAYLCDVAPVYLTDELEINDRMHLAINDTLTNHLITDTYDNYVFKRPGGVASGNGKTKYGNNQINQNRKIAGQFDKCLRSMTGFVADNEHRDEMAYHYFRNPNEWDEKRYIASVQTFLIHMDRNLVKFAFAGDDSSRTGNKLRCQNNADLMGFMWQTCNNNVTPDRVSEQNRLVSGDFCSHSAVRSPVGWLPCPSWRRVLSSVIWGLRKKTIHMHIAKVLSLALISYPLRFCNDCPTPFKKMTELLFEYGSDLMAKYNPPLPEDLEVPMGASSFFFDTGGNIRPISELTDVRRVEQMYGEKITTPFVTSGINLRQVPGQGRFVNSAAGKVENEAGYTACVYCNSRHVVKCHECEVDVFLCDKCCDQHAVKTGHVIHEKGGSLVECATCRATQDKKPLYLLSTWFACADHVSGVPSAVHIPVQGQGTFNYYPDVEPSNHFILPGKVAAVDSLIKETSMVEATTEPKESWFAALYSVLRFSVSFYLAAVGYELKHSAACSSRHTVYHVVDVDTEKRILRLNKNLVGWNMNRTYELIYENRIKGLVKLTSSKTTPGMLQYYSESGHAPVRGCSLREAQESSSLSKYKVRSMRAQFNSAFMTFLYNNKESKPLPADDSTLTGVFSEFAELDTERQNILRSAYHNRVTVVRGCPGSGKTHLLIRMLQMFNRLGKRVAVFAPSHAAVDVACERAIQTPGLRHYTARNFPNNNAERSRIDRSYGYSPYSTTRFLFSTLQTNLPTSYSPEVIIVDECSLLSDSDLITQIGELRDPNLKIILIGDPLQVPPVHQNPVHPSVSNIYNNAVLTNRTVVFELNRQFRMHPDICDFISKKYYQGKLSSTPTHADLEAFPLPRVTLVQRNGEATSSSAGGLASMHNTEEDELAREIASKIHHRYPAASVLVICNYNGTVSQLSGTTHASVSSVDSAQGGEADVVIYCTTTSTTHALLDNRVNVAISRARGAVIILVSPEERVQKYYEPLQPMSPTQVLLALNMPVTGENEGLLENEQRGFVDSQQPKFSEPVTSDGYLHTRNFAKTLAQDLLVDEEYVRNVPSPDIVAYDTEALHWVNLRGTEYVEKKGIPAMCHLGWAFSDGERPVRTSRVCYPMKYKTRCPDGTYTPERIDSMQCRFPGNVEVQEDGQKVRVPLFSHSQEQKIKKAKISAHDATLLFIRELAQRCVSSVLLVVWCASLEIASLAPYIILDSNAVCCSCSSREVYFKDVYGYKCCACHKDSVTHLVNPKFYDIRSQFEGRCGLEATHADCTHCGEINAHDPGSDAQMTLCLFFRAIRPKMVANAIREYHAPYVHGINKNVREVQAMAATMFTRKHRLDLVVDIGVGQMRQKYDGSFGVINIEPNCTHETVLKSMRRCEPLYRLRYEEFGQTASGALCFQAIHHLEPGSLREEHVLTSLTLRDDMDPKMRYSWDKDDIRFHTVGTNHIYFNEHYSVEDLSKRFPGYTIKPFDLGYHVCPSNGDDLTVASLDTSGALPSMPCVITTSSGSSVGVAGKSRCVDAFLKEFGGRSVLRRSRPPLTLLEMSRTSNESLDAIEYKNPDLKEQFSVRLSGYERRERFSVGTGVPSNKGWHKIMQLMFTLYRIGYDVVTRGHVYVIGAATPVGGSPMAQALHSLLPAASITVIDPLPMKANAPYLRVVQQSFRSNLIRPGAHLCVCDVYVDDDSHEAFYRELEAASVNFKTLLVKVTVSFKSWDSLERIFGYYKDVTILRPECTGCSSELWIVGSIRKEHFSAHHLHEKYFGVMAEIENDENALTSRPVDYRDNKITDALRGASYFKTTSESTPSWGEQRVATGATNNRKLTTAFTPLIVFSLVSGANCTPVAATTTATVTGVSLPLTMIAAPAVICGLYLLSCVLATLKVVRQRSMHSPRSGFWKAPWFVYVACFLTSPLCPTLPHPLGMAEAAPLDNGANVTHASAVVPMNETSGNSSHVPNLDEEQELTLMRNNFTTTEIPGLTDFTVSDIFAPRVTTLGQTTTYDYPGIRVNVSSTLVSVHDANSSTTVSWSLDEQARLTTITIMSSNGTMVDLDVSGSTEPQVLQTRSTAVPILDGPYLTPPTDVAPSLTPITAQAPVVIRTQVPNTPIASVTYGSVLSQLGNLSTPPAASMDEALQPTTPQVVQPAHIPTVRDTVDRSPHALYPPYYGQVLNDDSGPPILGMNMFMGRRLFSTHENDTPIVRGKDSLKPLCPDQPTHVDPYLKVVGVTVICFTIAILLGVLLTMSCTRYLDRQTRRRSRESRMSPPPYAPKGATYAITIICLVSCFGLSEGRVCADVALSLASSGNNVAEVTAREAVTVSLATTVGDFEAKLIEGEVRRMYYRGTIILCTARALSDDKICVASLDVHEHIYDCAIETLGHKYLCHHQHWYSYFVDFHYVVLLVIALLFLLVCCKGSSPMFVCFRGKFNGPITEKGNVEDATNTALVRLVHAMLDDSEKGKSSVSSDPKRVNDHPPRRRSSSTSSTSSTSSLNGLGKSGHPGVLFMLVFCLALVSPAASWENPIPQGPDDFMRYTMEPLESDASLLHMATFYHGLVESGFSHMTAPDHMQAECFNCTLYPNAASMRADGTTFRVYTKYTAPFCAQCVPFRDQPVRGHKLSFFQATGDSPLLLDNLCAFANVKGKLENSCGISEGEADWLLPINTGMELPDFWLPGSKFNEFYLYLATAPLVASRQLDHVLVNLHFKFSNSRNYMRRDTSTDCNCHDPICALENPDPCAAGFGPFSTFKFDATSLPRRDSAQYRAARGNTSSRATSSLFSRILDYPYRNYSKSFVGFTDPYGAYGSDWQPRQYYGWPVSWFAVNFPLADKVWPIRMGTYVYLLYRNDTIALHACSQPQDIGDRIPYTRAVVMGSVFNVAYAPYTIEGVCRQDTREQIYKVPETPPEFLVAPRVSRYVGLFGQVETRGIGSIAAGAYLMTKERDADSWVVLSEMSAPVALELRNDTNPNTFFRFPWKYYHETSNLDFVNINVSLQYDSFGVASVTNGDYTLVISKQADDGSFYFPTCTLTHSIVGLAKGNSIDPHGLRACVRHVGDTTTRQKYWNRLQYSVYSAQTMIRAYYAKNSSLVCSDNQPYEDVCMYVGPQGEVLTVQEKVTGLGSRAHCNDSADISFEHMGRQVLQRLVRRNSTVRFRCEHAGDGRYEVVIPHDLSKVFVDDTMYHFKGKAYYPSETYGLWLARAFENKHLSNLASHMGDSPGKFAALMSTTTVAASLTIMVLTSLVITSKQSKIAIKSAAKSVTKSHLKPHLTLILLLGLAGNVTPFCIHSPSNMCDLRQAPLDPTADPATGAEQANGITNSPWFSTQANGGYILRENVATEQNEPLTLGRHLQRSGCIYELGSTMACGESLASLGLSPMTEEDFVTDLGNMDIVEESAVDGKCDISRKRTQLHLSKGSTYGISIQCGNTTEVIRFTVTDVRGVNHCNYRYSTSPFTLGLSCAFICSNDFYCADPPRNAFYNGFYSNVPHAWNYQDGLLSGMSDDCDPFQSSSRVLAVAWGNPVLANVDHVFKCVVSEVSYTVCTLRETNVTCKGINSFDKVSDSMSFTVVEKPIFSADVDVIVRTSNSPTAKKYPSDPVHKVDGVFFGAMENLFAWGHYGDYRFVGMRPVFRDQEAAWYPVKVQAPLFPKPSVSFADCGGGFWPFYRFPQSGCCCNIASNVRSGFRQFYHQSLRNVSERTGTMLIDGYRFTHVQVKASDVTINTDCGGTVRTGETIPCKMFQPVLSVNVTLAGPGGIASVDYSRTIVTYDAASNFIQLFHASGAHCELQRCSLVLGRLEGTKCTVVCTGLPAEFKFSVVTSCEFPFVCSNGFVLSPAAPSHHISVGVRASKEDVKSLVVKLMVGAEEVYTMSTTDWSLESAEQKSIGSMPLVARQIASQTVTEQASGYSTDYVLLIIAIVLAIIMLVVLVAYCARLRHKRKLAAIARENPTQAKTQLEPYQARCCHNKSAYVVLIGVLCLVGLIAFIVYMIVTAIESIAKPFNTVNDLFVGGYNEVEGLFSSRRRLLAVDGELLDHVYKCKRATSAGGIMHAGIASIEDCQLKCDSLGSCSSYEYSGFCFTMGPDPYLSGGTNIVCWKVDLLADLGDPRPMLLGLVISLSTLMGLLITGSIIYMLCSKRLRKTRLSSFWPQRITCCCPKLLTIFSPLQWFMCCSSKLRKTVSSIPRTVKNQWAAKMPPRAQLRAKAREYTQKLRALPTNVRSRVGTLGQRISAAHAKRRSHTITTGKNPLQGSMFTFVCVCCLITPVSALGPVDAAYLGSWGCIAVFLSLVGMASYADDDSHYVRVTTGKGMAIVRPQANLRVRVRGGGRGRGRGFRRGGRGGFGERDSFRERERDFQSRDDEEGQFRSIPNNLTKSQRRRMNGGVEEERRFQDSRELQIAAEVAKLQAQRLTLEGEVEKARAQASIEELNRELRNIKEDSKSKSGSVRRGRERTRTPGGSRRASQSRERSKSRNRSGQTDDEGSDSDEDHRSRRGKTPERKAKSQDKPKLSKGQQKRQRQREARSKNSRREVSGNRQAADTDDEGDRAQKKKVQIANPSSKSILKGQCKHPCCEPVPQGRTVKRPVTNALVAEENRKTPVVGKYFKYLWRTLTPTGWLSYLTGTFQYYTRRNGQTHAVDVVTFQIPSAPVDDHKFKPRRAYQSCNREAASMYCEGTGCEGDAVVVNAYTDTAMMGGDPVVNDFPVTATVVAGFTMPGVTTEADTYFMGDRESAKMYEDYHDGIFSGLAQDKRQINSLSSLPKTLWPVLGMIPVVSALRTYMIKATRAVRTALGTADRGAHFELGDDGWLYYYGLLTSALFWRSLGRPCLYQEQYDSLRVWCNATYDVDIEVFNFKIRGAEAFPFPEVDMTSVIQSHDDPDREATDLASPAQAEPSNDLVYEEPFSASAHLPPAPLDATPALPGNHPRDLAIVSRRNSGASELYSEILSEGQDVHA